MRDYDAFRHDRHLRNPPISVSGLIDHVLIPRSSLYFYKRRKTKEKRPPFVLPRGPTNTFSMLLNILITLRRTAFYVYFGLLITLHSSDITARAHAANALSPPENRNMFSNISPEPWITYFYGFKVRFTDSDSISPGLPSFGWLSWVVQVRDFRLITRVLGCELFRDSSHI